MGDDDHDNLALRNLIKQSISRRKYEAFASLTYAAKSGDVEMVRDLLRKGVDINQADYDGRTAFAMVSIKAVRIWRKLTIPEVLTFLLFLYARMFRHVLRGITKLSNTFWKRG